MIWVVLIEDRYGRRHYLTDGYGRRLEFSSFQEAQKRAIKEWGIVKRIY